ncbi:YkgJ family cysteine cluster protein [Noviherbaspirillum massiliense]|uniref:YkgJ family cysteine cluster protein n=1 Tax=Noviherbaspirillum massiliense TaxID=1465823 RepID=UPI0002F7E726|nr:YkgJ family cysteine cluster protein [Noviherbaspirillum massiliense]
MSMPHSSTDNPCLSCGACCVTFRVSFYWAEAEVQGLAEHLTEKLNPFYSCMAGTNKASPRCQALDGKVGEEVVCGVYAHRPSPCRELQAGDEKCNRARIRHGLPPLYSEPQAA